MYVCFGGVWDNIGFDFDVLYTLETNGAGKTFAPFFVRG